MLIKKDKPKSSNACKGVSIVIGCASFIGGLVVLLIKLL